MVLYCLIRGVTFFILSELAKAVYSPIFVNQGVSENTIFPRDCHPLLIFSDNLVQVHLIEGLLLRFRNLSLYMRKLKNSELDRLDVAQFKKAQKTPMVLVLDNIRSLNNIGSVFRTADAFLIEKIYLCGITASPPHKDMHKTALGATESVAWEYRKNTVDLIKELQKDYSCLAVEQTENAIPLNQFVPKSSTKYALIFGNEVKGVSQEVVDSCQGVLEIPQYGTKHSLNISVSAGVVIWDLWSKLQPASK
jgi:tRNA G18 (ribose-2'-O)-methylase SpoU